MGLNFELKYAYNGTTFFCVKEDDGTYSNLREYELVRARDYKCVSVQGTTAIVHGLIEDAAKTMKSILLDRGNIQDIFCNVILRSWILTFYFVDL